jgi:hypothetical protein
MKPITLVVLLLTVITFGPSAYGSAFGTAAANDSSFTHIGFRITDASNKSKKIDRLKLRFYLLVDDQKVPLTIHYYHDEHGNRDDQIASLQIPQIAADSGIAVSLQFCSEKGCSTYDVSDITYSKGEQLYFKEFYHLEFYQFASFKQYKKTVKGNSRWEGLDQFSKKEMPKYVLAKWMPTAEIWTRYEVPFLPEETN